jgi:hypothetical protein
MNNYSIVRVGNEYVVQFGETRILKVASRRQAARLVIDAAELLEQVPAPSVGQDVSLACEGGAVPEPGRVVPDPGRVTPDRAEVS